ncbi:Phosphoribosylformylglycinamidine synthase [Dirofilaria immitis]
MNYDSSVFRGLFRNLSESEVQKEGQKSTDLIQIFLIISDVGIDRDLAMIFELSIETKCSLRRSIDESNP